MTNCRPGSGATVRTAQAFLLCVLAILSGCAQLQTDAISAPGPEVPVGDFPAPPLRELALEDANEPEPRTLEVDDAVRFLVWGHPELAHEAVVGPDGTLALPLAGTVRAAGRTPEAIADDVETRLDRRASEGPVRLRRNDRVKLSVWQHPDLTHEAIVQTDGNLTLPLVGEVLALDRTIAEVREEVRERLARYLSDPQVSILPTVLDRQAVPNARVSILPTRTRPRQVAVIGEVQLQGVQALSGSMRIMDVLSRAGYRDTAKLNSVIVIRDRDGSAPAYRQLMLADFIRAEAPDQNIYLRADDVIIVPKTNIARVGTFVEQFFTRTKPVFDWWVSAQQARFAEDLFRANVRLNEIIFQSLP